MKRWIPAFAGPALAIAIGAFLTFKRVVEQPDQDVSLYYQYSSHVLHGAVPYRDFPFEYPLLAIVPMVVPYLLTAGLGGFVAFAVAFAVVNAVFAGLIGVTLGSILNGSSEDAPQRRDWFLILLFTTVIVSPWRFDLFPALITALAVRETMRGRPYTAGVLLACGTAVKLYPLLLLPAILMTRGPDTTTPGLWRLRVAGAFAATLLVAVGLDVALCGASNAVSFLQYHSSRGVQIESVPAGIVFLGHLLHGGHIGLVYDYGAYHLNPRSAGFTPHILPWLAAILFLLAAARTYVVAQKLTDRKPARAVASVGALWILAFIISSKVFSLQYVIWLLPFAALMAGQTADRPMKYVIASVFALTAIEVITYAGLTTFDPISIIVLNLRNAACVVWFVMLLVERSGRDEHEN